MLRELAHEVRSRRTSARELVQDALDRVERLDPGIGAVVALRADAALAEADLVDGRVAGGEDPGALAGIPCLIKDIEDLRGLPTTHGSLLFQDAPPADRDGTTCARLRGAGAIPVGKSNTPEFATEAFTTNLVAGATRNPWDPAWSPGGSSGGSAAAVAAGMVPIATATDTGGSIRIPSALCGLIGIKPTNGVVARDPELCWPDLTTCGPLATDVDDLRILLEVMGRPRWSRRAEPRRPERVVAARRFGPPAPLPEAVEAAFQRALADVEEVLGLPVEAAPPDGLLEGDPDGDWGRWAAPELIAWLGRERAEHSLDLLHPTTRPFVELGMRLSLDDYLAVRARAHRRADALDAILGEAGIVATPTLAVEGWRPDGSMPESGAPTPPLEAYNTSVQNQTGHPAVTLPAGLLPNGLPFGLQLTGPRFADGMLLDLADAWQRARPWPAVAPGYRPFGS